MYLMNSKKISFIILTGLVLSLFQSVQAANVKNLGDVDSFLESSEFGFERRDSKSSALGKKGLSLSKSRSLDVSSIITVDLIDPFLNKKVENIDNKGMLNPLDDGIEDFDNIVDEDFVENLASFKLMINQYFEELEQKEDIDVIAILNELTIDRIVSSPVKYAQIYGHKYNEEDIIKLRINRSSEENEFQTMLNTVNVHAETEEEIEELEEVRQNAIEKFNALVSNIESGLNIINITVKEITSGGVVLLVDGKEYKILMKR